MSDTNIEDPGHEDEDTAKDSLVKEVADSEVPEDRVVGFDTGDANDGVTD